MRISSRRIGGGCVQTLENNANRTQSAFWSLICIRQESALIYESESANMPLLSPQSLCESANAQKQTICTAADGGMSSHSCFWFMHATTQDQSTPHASSDKWTCFALQGNNIVMYKMICNIFAFSATKFVKYLNILYVINNIFL